MIRKALIILVMLMNVMSLAMAQTSFTVIPPRNVIAGNKFSVTFRLKNGEGSGLKAPKIEGCTFTYGPSTSQMSNYSWTNGREERSTTIDYTFIYRADNPGEFTIGEASIQVDGKTLTTKPTTFTVLPPDKNRQSSGQGTGDPYDRQTAESSSSSHVNADDVLVRIILNKSRVYEQEAIVCTIKLYTKHSISSFLPTTQPAFDGFLIEEIPVSPTLNEVEHYNGQNYMTAILKQCILFPQKSGRLTINSGKYDVTVVQYERVGGFWGGNRRIDRDIKTSSNSASVEVMALPQPQPDGFTGAVGQFDISTKLSTQVFKTNDAASLTYKISGTGNIKYVKEPVIDLPSEFEQYQPVADISTRVSGNNISGTMTVDYTFVPQSVGDFTIGADRFVYFDPSRKEYITLNTPSYDIHVTQGAATSSATATVAKQGIASKNTDILHIHLGDLGLSQHHTFIFKTWWYWPLYLLLALALTAILLYRRNQLRLNADISGRRLANSGKVAKRRLRQASTYLRDHDNEHFYEELLRAMWGYLGDKLQLPASQLTRNNIAAELSTYGAPQSDIDNLLGIIDDCEMARYSPAGSEDQADRLYERASSLISSLENIKRAKK